MTLTSPKARGRPCTRRLINSAVSSAKSATPFPPPIKPPRRPLLWAAFAFGAGIVIGVHAWRPASWWVATALGFVAAGAYFSRRRTWLGFVVALGAMFFVGALEIQLRSSMPLRGGEILAFADGRETLVTAHVTKEGEIRAGSYGGSRQSIDIETEEIRDGGIVRPIQAGL